MGAFLCCSFHKAGSTPRANGSGIVPFTQGPDMISGGQGSPGNEAFKFSDDPGDFHGCDNGLLKLFDVFAQPGPDYIFRHPGFEFAFASEVDHCADHRFRQFQILCEDLFLPEGLPQGVLKRIAFPINRLGPFGLTPGSKNPPFFVLCFHDEKSEWRYKDVIYLCGPVFCRNDYVMKPVIDFFAEGQPHPKCGLFFAEPTSNSVHFSFTCTLVFSTLANLLLVLALFKS